MEEWGAPTQNRNYTERKRQSNTTALTELTTKKQHPPTHTHTHTPASQWVDAWGARKLVQAAITKGKSDDAVQQYLQNLENNYDYSEPNSCYYFANPVAFT